MTNSFGDLEITGPKTMRALAHPVRLAILWQLRKQGPATATQLAPEVGATPSVTSWHLRHLAKFGLVRDSAPGSDRRERRWEALGRGFRVRPPEDPADDEGWAATRALSRLMFLAAGDYAAQWLADIEPELDPEWRRLSGASNTRVALSPDELAHIEEAIDGVLAPYVTRDADQRPVEARDVRLLRYFLPDRAT